MTVLQLMLKLTRQAVKAKKHAKERKLVRAMRRKLMTRTLAKAKKAAKQKLIAKPRKAARLKKVQKQKRKQLINLSPFAYSNASERCVMRRSDLVPLHVVQ